MLGNVTITQLLYTVIGMALAGLTVGLGYTVEQWEFNRIITLYGLFFLIYIGLLYWVREDRAIWYFVGVGLLLRCILLFAIPGLSDDIYRFIWDGRLIINGINPFDQLPSYYIENNIDVPGLTIDLYEELNSPGYFTIYPPLAQAVFALAVGLFPNSILGSTIVMKAVLLACEAGSIYLLWQLLRSFGLPFRRILIYALNPLIIVEIAGNLHFEGMMIFFLLLSLWWLRQHKLWQSAMAIALSIGAKLLPLLFLPFLIRRLGWRRSLYFFSVTALVLIMLFLPLVNEVFIQNFSNSLDLYFRRFEFNASIYYLLRWYGWQIVGYNLIHLFGPLLAAATFLSIIVIAFFEKNPDHDNLPLRMLIASCIYLALGTTVHPWYLSIPVVLCIFTRYRFPILWSGLIMLSYINYSYEQYYENLWVIAVEYLAVTIFMVAEIKSNRL